MTPTVVKPDGSGGEVTVAAYSDAYTYDRVTGAVSQLFRGTAGTSNKVVYGGDGRVATRTDTPAGTAPVKWVFKPEVNGLVAEGTLDADKKVAADSVLFTNQKVRKDLWGNVTYMELGDSAGRRVKPFTAEEIAKGTAGDRSPNGIRYEYDALGRLVETGRSYEGSGVRGEEDKNVAVTEHYTNDLQGRPVGMRVFQVIGTVICPDDGLVVISGDQQVTERIVWSASGPRVIARIEQAGAKMDNDSPVMYVLQDLTGNVTTLLKKTSGTWSVAAHFAYDRAVQEPWRGKLDRDNGGTWHKMQ